MFHLGPLFGDLGKLLLDLKLLLYIGDLLFVHPVCFFEDGNLLFEEGRLPTRAGGKAGVRETESKGMIFWTKKGGEKVGSGIILVISQFYNLLILLAGGRGVEPRFTESESAGGVKPVFCDIIATFIILQND